MTVLELAVDWDAELAGLLDPEDWTVEIFGPWIRQPRRPVPVPPCQVVLRWKIDRTSRLTAVRTYRGDQLVGHFDVRPSVRFWPGDQLVLRMKLIRQ